jgi:carboxymethylenebutenolidase
VKTRSFDVKTQDGNCDAFVAHPDTGGPFPAVLFYMDAFGVRPYLEEMATELASKGYYVLLPNLFYRAKRAPITDVTFPMKAEDRERAWGQIAPLYKGLTLEQSQADARAFLDYLAKQKEVKPGPAAITGYCMGGVLAVRIAAWFPERISAAASFHPGHLATDAPDSPHLQLGRIRGQVYVAFADKDQSAPPEEIERFKAALEDAKVRSEVELYEGAMHGYAMRDLPPFNAEALKRHWTKLTALLARA